MNLVDSSCWLEFFAGSTVGELVSEPIENTQQLIVPAIVIYEVFKKLLETINITCVEESQRLRCQAVLVDRVGGKH